jgi:fibronectin-binding autotransporter adhesin
MIAAARNVVRTSLWAFSVAVMTLGSATCFVSFSDAAITLSLDVVPSLAVADPWDVGGSLSIGETLDGSMTVDADSDVTNTDGYVANLTGSTGAVTITGAGSTWTSSGELRMGNFGSGTLNVTDGGVVSVGGNARLGNVAGGIGTGTVDGPGSTLTSGNFILVGREGTGTLNVQNAGAVSDLIGGIAIFEGSSGSVTLDGPGSAWMNSNELQVADGGTATLNILHGAEATSPLGYLGVSAAGNGTVTVSGSGSAWNGMDQLQIGYGGTGTLNIVDSAAVSTNHGYLGVLVGGQGEATVNGAGSSWTNTNDLSVGYEGTGSLKVTGGATVSDATAIIGNLAAGTGSATVTGPGSIWTNSGTLTVGGAGTGALSIDDGGLVSAAALDGSGGVNFDGGILRIVADNFTTSALTLNSGGGTLDVDTPGTTVTSNGGISGPGAFTKTGPGKLELITANTYSGSTRVEDGTLNLGQPYLNDLADVYLAHGTSLGLIFSGTDQIDSLFIGDAAEPIGTYGAVGSGADFEMDLFSGTGLLRVTKVGLLGDYNDDGSIDAADYTVWRDRLGSTTSLPNDNTPGAGLDDYARWKANFGQTTGQGNSALQTASIPEPPTVLLLFLAATVGSFYHRKETALAVRRPLAIRPGTHGRGAAQRTRWGCLSVSAPRRRSAPSGRHRVRFNLSRSRRRGRIAVAWPPPPTAGRWGSIFRLWFL